MTRPTSPSRPRASVRWPSRVRRAPLRVRRRAAATPVSREQAAEGVEVPAAHGEVPPRQAGPGGSARRRVPPADRPHRSGGRTPGEALPALRPGAVGVAPARSATTSWPRCSPAASGGSGARDVPSTRRSTEVAAEHGRRAAARRPTPRDPDLERVRGGARARGTSQPSATRDLVLVNCPFDALAREHTELVCGVNGRFVHGVVDGLGCTGAGRAARPRGGLCCVKVRPSPRMAVRPGAAGRAPRHRQRHDDLEQPVGQRRHPVEAGPAHGRAAPTRCRTRPGRRSVAEAAQRAPRGPGRGASGSRRRCPGGGPRRAGRPRARCATAGRRSRGRRPRRTARRPRSSRRGARRAGGPAAAARA